MAETALSEKRSIPSDPVRFREIRCWIQRLSIRAGASAADARDLSVAVSEALANAHRHGYGRRTDGRIDIEIESRDGSLVVAVRDYGSSFDARRWTPPELDRPLEGGYGVYLMHRLTDRVTFPEVDSGTMVVMWKRCREALPA